MKKKTFKIHPLTLKSLKKGHPWVTLDQFSEKFPEDKPFIDIYHPDNNEYLGTFLNDKKHPRVKARFWSIENNKPFEQLFKDRLKQAINKRSKQDLKRNNFYLVFGEADLLPGLFIQVLSQNILIQYQSYFWIKYENFVINCLKESYPQAHFWTQKRITGESKVPPQAIENNQETEFHIDEFGIKYIIRMNLFHDIGIFSDMSALRGQLIGHFKDAGEVLNLFCYTGAFSLYALKAGARVTSVDLSKKYISWLEDNIKLNQFDDNQHVSLVKSCQKQIENFIEQKRRFDLIICDPPTVSTDGKKRMKATDFYKKYTDGILTLLNKNGKAIIVLNTHSINLKKFKELLIKSTKQKFSIVEQLGLSSDCSPLPNFPEGNYLKCLILKK